jgi:beta-glucanase (GH16 family)
MMSIRLPLFYPCVSIVIISLFAGPKAPVEAAEPVLYWADEFTTDGLPDAQKWFFDVGGDGWGNNEAQYYTDARLENARIEDGVLIIEARQDGWPLESRQKSHPYTSARIVSKGRADILYGRIEVRAKLPQGRGTWPAIWMLPTGNAYGTWPRSGEIDIMEHVGFDMGTVHGSLHTLNFNWSSGGNPTGSVSVPEAHTAFHTYSVDWTPEAISFAVDGAVYFSADRISLNWEDWPFDQPFYLILNLAVGGFWGGQQGIDPDIWPQRMEVDYVRFYDLGQTVPLDTDNDGTLNMVDPDDDGDGLSDEDEHLLGTNILMTDTDRDGFTDGEEVTVGTNPLLSSDYPGADPSLLLVNAAFEAGSDPWIVHTNLLNGEGVWRGQLGSWGGSYRVFDWVTAADETFAFAHYNAGDSAQAEHLLYQEWRAATAGIQAGDVIRFRGKASLASASPGTTASAFIRILDFAFLPMTDSVVAPLTDTPTSFALEAVIPNIPFNALQVGFLIRGDQTDPARITFSALKATQNEPVGSSTWAQWPIITQDGVPWVNTTDWMGWLGLVSPPWLWSPSLNGWVYLPEEHVESSGA